MNVSICLQMDLVLQVSGLLRNPSDFLAMPRSSFIPNGIRSVKLMRSRRLTVKLLDNSPLRDASRLRIVRWSMTCIPARSKAPDFDFKLAGDSTIICEDGVLGASAEELSP
jgi:hypothetical protein